MKNIFLFMAILCSSVLFAQEKGEVSGTILDAELHNEPVLFANISLKGTPLQARTNIFGSFELTDVEPGNYVLKIAFAGYETQEIAITVMAGEQTMVNTPIHAKSADLGEASQLGLALRTLEKIQVKSIQSMPND